MDPHEHPASRRGPHGSPASGDPGPETPSHSPHVDSWGDLALDLLEGTLPPEEAATLHAHLAGCAACRAALDEQRSMADLLRAVPQVAVPEGLGEEVLTRLSQSLSDTEAAAPRRLRPTEASKRPEPGVWTRLRALARPQVWLPAAAFALVLGVAVTTYYQAGLGRDGSPRADDLAATQESARSAESGVAESDGAATKETGQSDTTMTAAASTETTGASIMGAGPAGSAEPPSVQIRALEDAGAVAAPVVWVTVPLSPEQRESAALVVGALTDLQPVSPAPYSDALPAYVALISLEDVDAFTAALGSSQVQVIPLAEAEGLLPPEIRTRLAEDPAGLPRLQRATEDSGASYGWLSSAPPADPSDLAGLAVLAITLSAEVG